MRLAEPLGSTETPVEPKIEKHYLPTAPPATLVGWSARPSVDNFFVEFDEITRFIDSE